MRPGYWVTQIIDTTDLTGDNQSDIIIRWRKKQFTEGDTVRITIFTQNADSTFSNTATLCNLYTPIFTDYSKHYETGNAQLDSVYTKYIYSNYNMVEFRNETIIVGFFMDASGGADFYFSYKKNLKDWLLDKKVFWNQANKMTGKEITGESKVKEQIRIHEFNILDFID